MYVCGRGVCMHVCVESGQLCGVGILLVPEHLSWDSNEGPRALSHPVGPQKYIFF